MTAPILSLHRLRRVVQTPRAFRNWPVLLADMAREHVGRGSAELHFETRGGLVIDCPNRPGARVPVYEVFAEDCYRLASFLGPMAHRPIRVLDIGGHVGTFSCQLAALNAEARIEAFEPSRTTREFLARNVATNGFGDRVTVSDRAVAGSTGTASFSDNGAGSGLNGLADSLGSAAGSGLVDVPTVAFDEVVAAGDTPVDVVKIDCEGGEYDLVLNSSPRSWASVQRVVLEYHPHPSAAWPQLRTWFAEQGLAVTADEPVSPDQGTAWLARVEG